MRKLLVLGLLLPNTIWATGNVGVGVSIVQNTSKQVSIDNSSPSTKQVPVAIAPSLVTSNSSDVCLGSISGSVSGGGFGISAGTTTLDRDCVQRRDIRLLHNLGHPDAALAMMCQDAEMGKALRSVNKCTGLLDGESIQSTEYIFTDGN